MAIQLPNAGLGDGKTGDNEFVMWTKVKDNFSDQTNAASRLLGTGAEQVPLSKNIPSLLGTAATKNVGTAAGQIPLSQDVLKAAFQSPTREDTSGTITIEELDNFSTGTTNLLPSRTVIAAGLTGEPYWLIFTLASYGSNVQKIQLAFGNTYGSMAIRSKVSAWSPWRTIKSTLNTSVDANGFLKGASPIVKVHTDKVVLNDEAEQQNVTFKKNGVGDYTITTVSGLSTDGWYIELPKDMNGNPKVAVTLTEVDGVISLKSYKRIFSMETFTFVPDLESPLDIPDTRWIDLRLNEIPVEMPDDIQTEV